MRTVLFVCFHNVGRSQMAEAIFNRIATEKNLALHAISAGTVAGREINPVVVTAMSMIGVSMGTQKPKQLMQWHVDVADKIITMHCGVDPENCPTRFKESEDWGLDDPVGLDLPAVCRIRDDIAAKVKELVNRMAAMPPPV